MMFFYAAKLISMVIFPLPLFLIVTALFLSLSPRFRWKRLYVVFFALFWMVSTPALSQFLIRSLENDFPSTPVAGVDPADAIVLLGGMILPQKSSERPEFDTAADRLFAAEELLHAKKAPLLLISGGTGLVIQDVARPEAELLAEWLVRRNGHPLPLLVESRSRNTAENALYSASLLIEKRDKKRIILVTSAFHMERALRCFRKVGFTVVPFPVDYRSFDFIPGPEFFLPGPDALQNTTIALKEYLGLVAYRIKGYI